MKQFKYLAANILQSSRVVILLLILSGVHSLWCQVSYAQPHAQEMAQFGNLHVDQAGGFVGTPRDLVPREDYRDPSHVVFGYHPYWNGTAWQNYVYDILSHIAWFGLTMGSGGNITNANGWPVNGLVDLAHSHGVKVIVTVTLFDSGDIGTLLGNAGYRQAAINNLIARVSQGNADGVNIDFEFVPAAARSNFNTFIHDLTQTFHDQIPGSEVSIAMPAVDWWNSYDYNYLSDNADGLMIMAYGYYWSGSSNAGPLSPLNSGFSSWYIRRTVEDYLTKTGDDPSQLILGLPWYGRDWPVSSTSMGAPTTGGGSSIFYSTAEANAQSYGKHYNSGAPSAWYNYSSGGYHQVWYDDSLSLATKYAYAKTMNMKGIGIWALGYDGGRQEIWGGLNDAFGSTAPPLAPAYFSSQNTGTGVVLISCAETAFTDQYQVFGSQDGESFTFMDSSSSPEIELAGLNNDTIYYFKVRSQNSFGVSNFSETLGVSVNTSGQSPVLVVQGFERTSGTTNNFDFIIQHGSAIQATGRHFDSASNDAIETGSVVLDDYAIVDWISGEEATATVSFSPTEQTRIAAYLEQGGRIFISGSEIGYDLEGNGSNTDYNFYRNYFKADYVSDDAQSYATYGTSNGIFSGLTAIPFDNGTHGSYDVDYPDGIKPFGGSTSNLRYEGADYASLGGAGIQYIGHFGASNALGGIVYLGFGFETIYPAANRELIMGRVLDYLETSLAVHAGTVLPKQLHVSAAYPNPFNGAFAFQIIAERSLEVSIALYNIRGQLVTHLQRSLIAGSQTVSFTDLDAAALNSGVYVLEVSHGVERYTQNITYLK